MKTHTASKLRYILLTKEQLKNRLRTKATFYVDGENGTQCLPQIITVDFERCEMAQQTFWLSSAFVGNVFHYR